MLADMDGRLICKDLKAADSTQYILPTLIWATITIALIQQAY